MVGFIAAALFTTPLEAVAAPIIGGSEADSGTTAQQSPPSDGLSVTALLALSPVYGGATSEDLEPEVPQGAARHVATPPGSGHSLRDVARSILTVDPLGQEEEEVRRNGPERAARDPLDDAIEARSGVVETLLDSETLGEALQAVVRVIDVNGNARVFSVFGLGEFQINVSHDGSAAAATDSSNDFGGTSFGRDDGVRDANAAPVSRTPVNLLLVPVEFFFEFLSTPFGIVLAVVVALYLAFSLIVKFGGLVRQRRMASSRSSRRHSATPHSPQRRRRRRSHRYPAR